MKNSTTKNAKGNTMFTFIKKHSKKLALSVVAITAIAIPVAVYAGYGPVRPTYNWNNPADRGGSLNGPVFNSFINTPTYGDERNHARIADVVANQSPNQADFKETETADAGKTYWVRTFVHNNANQTTNNGVGVAQNTRVKVKIAEGVANGVDVMSYVSADNAINKDGQPMRTIWDTATLSNSSRAFEVAYVPGSAILYNVAHQEGVRLPDAITSDTGALIGNETMDGKLKGCFDKAVYVYVKVLVKSPDLEVSKLARVQGSTDWKDSVSTKLSDKKKIQWQITFRNIGNTVARNVTIRDMLPKGVTLVSGSIKWFDINHQNGEALPDNALNAGGINLGNYAPVTTKRSGVIEFETTINSDFKDCELTNVAYARAADVPEKSDDAKVTIENCNPPEEENCPVPGKENLPKDSPDCVEVTPVTKVTTIPSTGVAGIASGLVGGTALSYSLYAWAESKRTLKNLLRLK